MKTVFYLNGEKITRKAVKESVGEKRLKEILAEAKEIFFDDPLTEISYMACGGILTIEFV